MRLQRNPFHRRGIGKQLRAARGVIINLENVRHDIGVLRLAERARRVVRHQAADNVVQIVERMLAVFPASAKSSARKRRRRIALQYCAVAYGAVLLIERFTPPGLGFAVESSGVVFRRRGRRSVQRKTGDKKNPTGQVRVPQFAPVSAARFFLPNVVMLQGTFPQCKAFRILLSPDNPEKAAPRAEQYDGAEWLMPGG